MNQNTQHPDPEQLQKYANEPMSFHNLHEYDWTLVDDSFVIECGNVTYTFEPTYINVETAKDEWHRVSDIDFEYSFVQAWEQADNIEAQEDFICATGIVYGEPHDPYQFNAYWILKSVIISNQ